MSTTSLAITATSSLPGRLQPLTHGDKPGHLTGSGSNLTPPRQHSYPCGLGERSATQCLGCNRHCLVPAIGDKGFCGVGLTSVACLQDRAPSSRFPNRISSPKNSTLHATVVQNKHFTLEKANILYDGKRKALSFFKMKRIDLHNF